MMDGGECYVRARDLEGATSCYDSATDFLGG